MPEAFLSKLHRRHTIAEQEDSLLRGLFSRERAFATSQDIVPAGSRPSFSCLIEEGLTARYKILPSGGRQITAIHCAGDFVDLHGFLLRWVEHGVMALTPCRIAIAEHDTIRQATEAAPRLARILWTDTVVDAAIFQEWLVSMGRRTAVGRLAHLLCELHVRLETVGRTEDMSFRFPLTQSVLADVLGLSVVHVNRTISELKRENLVTWNSHKVRIEDWDRLAEVAEFNPEYLTLNLGSR